MSEKRLIPSTMLFTAIEKELHHHHLVSFTVTGMSMWSLLCHDRDKVIIASCSANDLKKRGYRIIANTIGKLSTASGHKAKTRSV